MNEQEHDKEIGRWQQAIYEAIKGHSGADAEIDGGSCDSGDPLDLTLTEIAQGFNYLDNLLFEAMESVSHSKIEGSTFLAAAELIKKLAAENEELNQNTCSECGPENYGWIFNRVEGKAACGCMIEAEPFQILLQALETIAKKEFIHGAEARFIALTALKAILPLDYENGVKDRVAA